MDSPPQQVEKAKEADGGPDASHVEDTSQQQHDHDRHDRHDHHDHHADLKGARQANAAEHEQTLAEAFTTNRKAIWWSVVISMTIVMEGYDIGLISQFFAYPAFERAYGEWRPELNRYVVTSAWQAGLGNGGTAGVILGGFANGFLSARYGYKKVVLGALFFMNWFIFIPFFAKNPETLVVGQILCGLTWGVFATTGPAYASEVCPLQLRGYLTCYVNLCWAIGQLIAAGVLYGLLKLDNQWSYRIAYAVQWAWPVPLFVLILFAPESPWYLLKRDRVKEAERALCKLDDKSAEDHQKVIAQMLHTLSIENSMEAGTTYWDCFRGIDRRRTEIVCLTFAGQILSGSPFAYGPSYFLQQVGFPANQTYAIGLGNTGLAFVGTILSWFLLSRFGRRTIYLTGMVTLALVLLVIGIIAVASESAASKWVQVGCCFTWLFTYSLTIGPICYTIISETSAVRLRAKSVALSRNVYNITQLIANIITPYMLNPTSGNWKGKTAFFWFGTAVFASTWTYFRLPECRGRTYEELDILFQKGVSARNFASYKVDAYADHGDEDIRTEKEEGMK